MPRNKRVSKSEYQNRLDVIMGLTARGLSTMQVVKVACQQWDICERQALRYLKEAKEQEENLIHLPLASQYSRLLLQLDFIFKQAIHLEDLELTRRIAVDRARLLIQQRKELMNDTNLLHQSRLVGSDELEEIIRSLESEGKNYPA